MAKLSKILSERGYIYQHTGDTIEEVVDGIPRTFYWGVDPSADSMHIGHLMCILVLRHFVEAGHRLTVLIGGGTGMIGDQSSKNIQRAFLSTERVTHNVGALRNQLSQLLGRMDFEIVNNAEWLRSIDVIDFLRNIGQYFTINELVKREGLRPRLESPDAHISYAEFTYAIVQAYDFFHLRDERGCSLQVGASDQWGNIISGVDLILRKTGEKVHAFTWPLLIDKKTGKKFGGSKDDVVWLDAQKTSPFQFYQFWFNVEDDVVEEYLFKMTLLAADKITDILATHRMNPDIHLAQSKLAWNVTGFVHGEETARVAEAVSRILFSNIDIAGITERERNMLMKSAPNVSVNIGDGLVNVLVCSGLALSKRAARELITSEAISLNANSVTNPRYILDVSDFTHRLAILKRGKRYTSVLILNH